MVLAVVAGAFGSLDTALNIAFPDLVDDLGLSVADLRWVVVCFVLSYGSLLLAAGRLGDRFDHRRVLLIGGAVSTLALAACAAAPTYDVLLAARVVQGLAAALVMAGAPALLAAAGAGSTRVASIFQAAAGIGLAIGPVLGGPLVAIGGWRAVFWFRVPVAAALVGLAIVGGRRRAIATDLSRATTDDRSPSSRPPSTEPPAPETPGPTGGAEPPATGRLTSTTTRRALVVANALTALVNGTVFVTWLLVPTLLLDELALPVIVGGLVLAASPVATALASLVADRWVVRFGRDRVAVAGVAASTVGLALLLLVAGAGRGPATVAIAITLAVTGFGLGLFSVPNMALVMGALPADRQGTAGGLSLMMRTIGIVAGVNAAGLLFGSLEDGGWAFVDAFRATVGAAVVVGVLATALARWQPDEATGR